MVLAYNEDRSAMGEFPMTKRVRRLFGNDFKIYVLCRMDAQGQLHIDSLVKSENEPDW